MPTDPSKLTIGAGSNIGSAAGVQAPSSPFSAIPGTGVSALNAPATAATPTSLGAPAPSYLTSAPKLPLPTSSAGQPAIFGSNVSSGGGTSTNLADYLPPTPTSLANGGISAVNGSNNVVGGTGFNIDTSNVNSSALGSGTTNADVMNQLNQYQQYIQNYQQAQQYSPDYLAANARYNSDVANNSMLANQINNPNAQADTLGQLQTTIGRAQTGNAAQQAADAIALQNQTLLRTGNIAAAQAPLQYLSPSALNTQVSPGSTVINQATGQPVYSGLGGLQALNSINSVNQLGNTYPSAGILPTDDLVTARNKVASSPAYQAQFLSTYTTPGGGTGILSKTNTGLLTQNSDGTLQLVSGLSAAVGAANASSLTSQVSSYNTTQSAFNIVDSNFGNISKLMNAYGLNQTGVPLVDQLKNSVFAQTPGGAGAVAALKAGIQELRTNLATVISRGGSVAGSNEEAAALVPDNLSPQAMGKLGDAIKTYGQTALSQLQNQIAQTANNLSAGTTGGGVTNPGAPGGSVGSSWGNLLTQ